jgi:hypothetical protein
MVWIIGAHATGFSAEDADEHSDSLTKPPSTVFV